MKPRILFVLFLLSSAALVALYPTLRTPAIAPAPTMPAGQPRLAENYGKLPLAFEANNGQTDALVKFVARGQGYTMFLTGDSAVLSLKSRQSPVVSRQSLPTKGDGLRTMSGRLPPLIQNPKSKIQNPDVSSTQPPAPSVLRMTLVGANAKAKVTGSEELPGRSNYFIGNDPKKWRTNVPNYARVKYQGVYPGIDLVYYGNQRQLEYDFVVAPGADPNTIRFAIDDGNSKIETRNSKIDASGDLVISTDAGDVRFHKPVVYQSTAPSPQSRQFVDGRYVLAAHNRVSFEVGPYDKSRPLVIDPVLNYATYLGGDGTEVGFGIAVDSSGNAYVTGFTSSANFPVSDGSYDHVCDTCTIQPDAFLTKLSPDGSAIVYSTFIGGDLNDDKALAVAVDSTTGSAFIAGFTDSPDFPTTADAYQKNNGGDFSWNGFIAKFGPNGDSLVFSTILGGGQQDYPYALAIDAGGAVYVTGQTDSPDFPTKNALQSTFGGGNLCGFFGGDPCPDAFVTKLNAAGSDVVYSTYLGKTGEDYGTGIDADSSGNTYVAGYTRSSNFPTLNPRQPTHAGGIDGFVLKLNTAGALAFSTFLGGNGNEFAQSLALDSDNNIYVAGATFSTNFPTASPFQNSNAGDADAFLTKMNSSGSSLLFSTYLGGAGTEVALGVAVDSSKNMYVAGETTSAGFPTVSPTQATYGGGLSDAFVTQFGPSGGTPVFSTFLGGDGQEMYSGGFVAVNDAGDIVVTCETTSSDLTVVNALQPTLHGTFDGLVAKFSPIIASGVSFTPGSLNFGDQTVGIISDPPKSVILKNSGNQALKISLIEMNTGTEFAQTNNCPISPLTLGAGSSCTIDATFSPTSTGAKADEIIVTSDAPGSPHHVDLTGVGVPPAPLVNLSVDVLTFADQLVDSAASTPKSVLLTNTGTAALEITSVLGDGEFVVDNQCPLSPATIDINASCTINASFAPTTRGTHTGHITILDNTAAATHTIALSGKGIVPPTADVSAESVDFGNQLLGKESAAQTVTLTNNGDSVLDISGIWIQHSAADSTPSPDFSYATTCATSLGAGESCTFSLKFAPTATGTLNAVLKIAAFFPDNPRIVQLSGNGTDFAVVIPPAEGSKIVTAGQTAAYGLQLEPTGFSGNVALGCAFQGSAPQGARCSVLPTSVAMNGVDAAPFTVSVSTTARSTAGLPGPSLPPSLNLRALRVLAVLLMLMLLGAVAASRRQSMAAMRAPAWSWMPLASAMLFVLLCAACGGGEPPKTLPCGGGTCAGTYNLTLSATTSGVTKTSALTLKVN